MTEEEWASGDLKKLLKYLHKRGTERKRRLFGVACGRRIWRFFRGPACHEALNTAERYADGIASLSDLSAAEAAAHEAFSICRDAHDAPGAQATDAVYGVTCTDVGWDIADFAATQAATAVGRDAPRGQTKKAQADEAAAQLHLLRDIFGNPFRPVAFSPAWRSSNAALLATGIYEERAWDRMPILADALQDAGCDSDELLNHLRDSDAVHVRGCWALDLVLGKE